MSKPSIRELLDHFGDGPAKYIEDADRELAERVEAVLKLHEPHDYGDGQPLCFECHWTWPCPTKQALDGEA